MKKHHLNRKAYSLVENLRNKIRYREILKRMKIRIMIAEENLL